MELIILVSTTSQRHAHHQMMMSVSGQQTMTWTKRQEMVCQELGSEEVELGAGQIVHPVDPTEGLE